MNTNNGLSIWRDFSPAYEFRREFDRLLDDWITPSRAVRNENLYIPTCDVEESEDHYLLTLEIAGVKKDDIRLEIIDNQIVITGERHNESRKKENSYAQTERRFGKFYRAFALPVGVDGGKVEAHYEDGVLHVMVPKAESAKPRQVKIGNGPTASKFFGKILNSTQEKEEKTESRIEKAAS